MQKAICSINSIIRKFGKCSDSVKITLFRTYCTTMYTPHLWWNHTKVSIKKLQVAYNNIFRVLCHEDKFCSASLMFVSRAYQPSMSFRERMCLILYVKLKNQVIIWSTQLSMGQMPNMTHPYGNIGWKCCMSTMILVLCNFLTLHTYFCMYRYMECKIMCLPPQ